MIERYALPEMTALWSDATKFGRWLQVELLALEAWVEAGRVPREALDAIQAASPAINVERIATIETEVRHDVIAFVTSITEQLGPEGRYLHLGLTSSDVIDTAFASLLVEAHGRIQSRIAGLMQVLGRRAEEHRHTVMIGRSHGIHAEPTTFGLKCALWFSAFTRHAARLTELRPRLAVGKLSGAVGTYANVSPQIEAFVCARMGLTPATVATQVVQRDHHAEFFNALALMAGTVEQMAVEVRHLQRTEVSEVSEAFGKGQKGSSAMPHKRNPILAENLTGCARLMRSYAGAALENIALWHERDISHSSVERVIAPDATILLDFMLHRLTGLMEGLEVHEQRMRENVNATQGLIFSQQLLSALVEAGMTREEAYRLVQQHALAAWEARTSFEARVVADPAITQHLNSAALTNIFDPQRLLQHVDTIFDRCFASHRTAA